MKPKIEYTPVEFTDDQRKEFIRLMLGLTFVQTKKTLRMNIWSSSDPHETVDECGTSACAWGYAPLFCKNKPIIYEGWDEYMLRILGWDFSGHLYGFGEGYRKFIFGTEWSNSWQQVVARMYIALTKGIPYAEAYSFESIYCKPSDLVIENYALEYGVTVDEVYDRACEMTV